MAGYSAYSDFSNGVPGDVVAEIYEAATRPDGLPQVAALLARAADAGSGVAYLVEGHDLHAGTHGLPGEARRQHMAYYHRIDPWYHKSVALGLSGRVVLGSSVMSGRELRQTEYFADFARRFDTVEALGADFSVGGGRWSAIGVHRADRSRPFGEEEAGRLGRLLPYLRGAMRLRVSLGTSAAERFGLAALDALAAGAVVCDGSGHVKFANRAAEEAAASGVGLVLGNERRPIGARLAGESRRLGALVGQAAAGMPGGAMTVSGADGTECLLLVTPLAVGDHEGRRLALLTFRAPATRSRLDRPALRQLFGLTAAEASIALALLEGQSLREIGAARQVTENTLRTQLGHVLRKTGTANQRELVRLLGLLPALRRDGDR